MGVVELDRATSLKRHPVGVVSSTVYLCTVLYISPPDQEDSMDTVTVGRRLYTPQALFRRDPADLQRLIRMATFDYQHDTAVYHGMTRTETKMTAQITITDACAAAYAQKASLAELDATLSRLGPDVDPFGLCEILVFARNKKITDA